MIGARPTTPAARAARAALARLRHEERGLTIVEGLVAALLLVLGALSVLQVFDASTRNNFRAEQSQVLNNRLQAELEAIAALPYAEIALTAPPATSSNPNDPRWRVQGTTFAVARSGGDLRQMAVNGFPIPGSGETVSGGVVDPGPEPFSTGDISGEIYRFVTWASDPACPACGSGVMKRVVVAARVDRAAVSFDRRFQEVHTEVADPEARPEENPAPPGEEAEGSTASFWLTDTTCDNSTRREITADHPAHNTLGRCADGAKTGGTRGAPDLMFTQAPALAEGTSPEEQELFDYATDVVGSSEDEIGLAMRAPATNSCLLEPVLSVLDLRRALEGLLAPLASTPGLLDGVLDLADGGPDRHLRVHKWLSPPVPGSGGVLTGRGTLELYTKTVDGAIGAGEICVSLFNRQTVQLPVCLLGLCLPAQIVNVTREADVPYLNVGPMSNQDGFVCEQELNLTFFRCRMNQWPTEWKKISIPMDFVAVNAAGAVVPAVLPPNSRVGLSIMVRQDGTSGEGLEFMYDAVGFESRLELQTEAIIPF